MARDLYYNPEHFNIEIVVSHNKKESYGFDMFVGWRSLKDPSLYYWATDSGCSCPSPFENYTSLDQAASGTAHELAAALQKWNGAYDSVDITASLERLLSV
jgi:hypothetical protein